MPEELKADGLGHLASGDPATLAARQQANDLKDKEVYDVNGTRLGRVTRCFAEEGTLLRCDVTLTDNAKALFEADADVAGVPAAWIAAVEGDKVRLRKAAEEILHPDEPGPVHAEPDRGAPGFPRKRR